MNITLSTCVFLTGRVVSHEMDCRNFVLLGNNKISAFLPMTLGLFNYCNS